MDLAINLEKYKKKENIANRMIKVRRRMFNVLSCCQPDEVFTCSVDAIKRRLNNDYDYDLILKCNSSREYYAMCIFLQRGIPNRKIQYFISYSFLSMRYTD